MPGLLSAVLNVYRPELHLNTSLPQKVKPKLYIPTDEDIQTLLANVDDEDMMIAILHAAFGPMRRSEICALESTDIENQVIHVQHAMGIPDAYIMQRGGWGSDAVLKQIYHHALSDQEVKMNDIANKHFENLCNTKCNTK